MGEEGKRGDSATVTSFVVFFHLLHSHRQMPPLPGVSRVGRS